MKLLEANLPDKLSDVILLALEDLRKVERSKKYNVNMGNWHDPNGACSVCFAGALISQSDEATPEKHLEPDDFEPEDEIKFYALNHLRCYEFEDMLDVIGGSFCNNQETAILAALYYQFDIIKEDNIASWGFGFRQTDHLPEYHHHKAGFKQNMETVAAILQEHGL